MSAENGPIAIFEGTQKVQLAAFIESLVLLERLHRLLLDVIKDEFERLGVLEINSVQALLLFNIGDNEVTAGELKSRGYYQGSNVSYNLKKLVELGYMHHQRSEIDRRSVRVRLTDKGRRIRSILTDLFARQADQLDRRGMIEPQAMDDDQHLAASGWSGSGPSRSATSTSDGAELHRRGPAEGPILPATALGDPRWHPPIAHDSRQPLPACDT